MNPTLALLVYAVGIALLFRLDRDARSGVSLVLWLPVVWVGLGASRLLSMWLNPTSNLSQAEAYLEGNPLDRNVQSLLLLAGLVVLAQRRADAWRILRTNAWLCAFVLYCGVSAVWSDYPGVSFKRWIKSLGDVVMVLVVLVDRDPRAMERVATRLAFLLIPASILLMKYFPTLARNFNWVTGEPEYTGVATSKNGLGALCMLFGLFSAAQAYEVIRNGDVLSRWPKLLAHIVIVTMVVWLFRHADSVTSAVTLVLAFSLVVVSGSNLGASRPWLLQGLLWTYIAGTAALLFGGVGNWLLGLVGRNASLTGRTDIWEKVLGMVERPMLGTGFESFWLGDRLLRMTVEYGSINQSHNGYVEVFVNLGWVGILLLAAFLLAAYRNAFAARGGASIWSRLQLSYFVIGVMYNFTEAAFKAMSPVWFMLIASSLALPAAAAALQQSQAVSNPPAPLMQGAIRPKVPAKRRLPFSKPLR